MRWPLVKFGRAGAEGNELFVGAWCFWSTVNVPNKSLLQVVTSIAYTRLIRFVNNRIVDESNAGTYNDCCKNATVTAQTKEKTHKSVARKKKHDKNINKKTVRLDSGRVRLCKESTLAPAKRDKKRHTNGPVACVDSFLQSKLGGIVIPFLYPLGQSFLQVLQSQFSIPSVDR